MKLLRFLRWLVEDTWRRFREQDALRSHFAVGLTTAPGVRVFSPHRLTVDGEVHLDQGAYLHCGDADWCRGAGGIRIGGGSYVGPHCTLFGMGSVEIGKGVLISPGCVITSLRHPVHDTSVPISEQPRILQKVVIEDDVYLGSNVVVTPCDGLLQRPGRRAWAVAAHARRLRRLHRQPEGEHVPGSPHYGHEPGHAAYGGADPHRRDAS